MPEAYRQRFRTWEKSIKQMHVEFAWDLVNLFSRWCASLQVNTYEALCNLTVLEQFKRSIPSNIAVYVSECQVKMAAEAAALADEFVLTHKSDRGYKAPEASLVHTSARWGERQHIAPGKRDYLRGQVQPDSETVCNFCKGNGHWKVDRKRDNEVNSGLVLCQ